jgi:ABC-2 type transport system ATP-binding protein
MISVQHLTKNYGNGTAVSDVSFEVQRGQIVGFLGPNGAGKTTTMKMLTCYLPPSTGTFSVNGLEGHEKSVDIRRQVGYLPEQTPLYEEMNVQDYLMFVASMRGVEKTKRRNRVEEYATRCGLDEVMAKTISTLSKGYKQRVGLAQALVHDPAVLILDEPTSGLDPSQKSEILDLIRHLGQEKTVLLSTHILSEVEAICERVLILNKGKLVADSALSELQATFNGQQQVLFGVMDTSAEALQAAFAALPHVQLRDLKQQDAEWLCTITSSEVADIRPELFRFALQHQWTLTELHREQANLDDIFKQLTAH